VAVASRSGQAAGPRMHDEDAHGVVPHVASCCRTRCKFGRRRAGVGVDVALQFVARLDRIGGQHLLIFGEV
jgi:hypothetical protein